MVAIGTQEVMLAATAGGDPNGWNVVRRADLDLNAKWAPTPHRYRRSDIIRIDVGGRYEASLARVAELTPEPAPMRNVRFGPRAGALARRTGL